MHEFANGIVRILENLHKFSSGQVERRYWIAADAKAIFALHETLLGEPLEMPTLPKNHKKVNYVKILTCIKFISNKVQVKLGKKDHKHFWISLKDEDDDMVGDTRFTKGYACYTTGQKKKAKMKSESGWGMDQEPLIKDFAQFKRIAAEFGVDFGVVDTMDAFEKSEMLLQRVYELGYKRIVSANLIKKGYAKRQEDIAKNSEFIGKVKKFGLKIRKELVKFQDLTMNDLLFALEDTLIELKQAREKIKELQPTHEKTDNTDSLLNMNEIKQYQEMERDLIALRKENSDLKKRIKEIEIQNGSNGSSSLIECDIESTVNSNEEKNTDIVEKIRAEKGSLLMDLDVAPEVKTTLNSLYRSLDSAVQRLAEDIYSSKTRFFLELVQNADDNSYDLNVQPQLSIRVDLSKKFIWTRNNEIGFSDENLRAICDIGGSTKKNSQSIGYKGIGFKSSFKITNTPMILSGDINVYFDCRKKLGYLMPNNLTSDSYELLRSNGLSKDVCGTNFFLPFRDDVDIKVFRNEVTQIFESLEYVILFTRKISGMDLKITGSNEGIVTKSVEIFKKNIRNYEEYTTTTVCNLVQNSSKMFVFRKIINIPYRFRKNRNEQSTETEITLAFTEEEKEYPIYSYLPVKNVGFKFIINADFELTANRQDIHESDGWNLFLRDQIPEIICEALKSLDIDSQSVIHLIPSLSEIRDPFWKVLVEHFRRIFIDQEIIQGQSGSFRKISQLFLRSDILGDLFSTDELWLTLGKEYVHINLEMHKEQLTEKLGMKEISVFDVINILERMDLSQKSNDWFLNLYEYLYNVVCGKGESLDVIASQGLFQSYAKLKILPSFHASNFELKCFLDGPLFYDVDEAIVGGSIIIPEIVNIIHIKDPSEISIKFFELLGAKKAGFMDIFNALVSYNSIYSSSINSNFCVEQFRFLYRNRDKIFSAQPLRYLQDLYFVSEDKRNVKLRHLSLRSDLLEFLNSFNGIEFQFICPLGIDAHDEQIWFESMGLRPGPALNAENPLNSLMNTLKFFPVLGNIEINCSFLAYLDRYWTEISNNPYFLPEFKLINKEKSFLKSAGYEFGVAFLEKPFKSEFRLHHLPYLNLKISNASFLSCLGVFDAFTLKCADTIANQLYPEILHVVNESARTVTWRMFYEVLQNLNFGKVLQSIYVPDIGYVQRSEMIFQGDSNVAKLLNMKVMSLVYPRLRSLLVEQFGANLTFTMRNISTALEIISQRSYANEFIERLSGKEWINLITRLYEYLEIEVKNEPLTENQRMNLPIFIENQTFKTLRMCSECMIALKDLQNYQGIFGEKLIFVHPAISNFEALWKCVGIVKASAIIQTSISAETKECCVRNDFWANIYCSVLKNLIEKYKSSLLFGQIDEISTLANNLTVFETQILKASYRIKSHNSYINDTESEREEYFLFDKTRSCLFIWSSCWFDLGTSGFLFKALYALFPFIELEKLKAFVTFEELQHCSSSAENQEKSKSIDTLQNYPVIVSNKKRKIFHEKEKFHFKKDFYEEDEDEEDYDLSHVDLTDAVNEIKRSVLKISPDSSKVQMVNRPYYVEREPSQTAVYFEKKNNTGKLGECFAYQLISSWISASPHNAPFTMKNWVSSARKDFFPNESAVIDDSLGYDMYYEDFTGAIPCFGNLYKPAPGKKITWMFEVKSHRNLQKANRFFLSNNEYDVASRCTNSVTSEYRYVIIGVVLRPEPKLVYWLEDPYEMNQRGNIRLQSKQFIASNYPSLQ